MTAADRFATLADVSPNSPAMTATSLSPSLSPLEVARELAPLIRASADEIDAARQLPRPRFSALADAGLFLMAVPRAVGGSGLGLAIVQSIAHTYGGGVAVESVVGKGTTVALSFPLANESNK